MTKPSKLQVTLLSSPSQMVVGFLMPTVILLYLSDDSRLGPLWAMTVALAFPLALELYSFKIRRKPSYVSLMAIVGILIIGAISLFGLSENWLAVRRSIVYVAFAASLLLAVRFRRRLIDRALSAVIDVDRVYKAAEKQNSTARVTAHVNRIIYLLVILLIGIAVATFASTVLYISAPNGTSAFNAQYAQLRVLSLGIITLPLLVGTLGLLVYLVTGIEKLTDLKAEDLLKKK